MSDERETLDSKILSDVYVLVREATKTVCQEQCRCAGNPHLFDEDNSLQIFLEDDNGVCPSDKTCLYFGFEEKEQDSYNYEKCAHYLHTSAYVSESHFADR